MPTEDDITLFLRENIDPEVLLDRSRNGNILEYLSNVSKKMIEQFRMGTEPRRDVQIHESQTTETRRVTSTPQTRRNGGVCSGDSVEVSEL